MKMIAIKYITSTVLGVVLMSSIADAKTMSENMINQRLVQMESPVEDMLDDINNENNLKLQFKKISDVMIELNKLNTNRNITDNLSRKIALQNSWFKLISVEITEMDDLSALASVINQFSGQLIISTHFDHEYSKEIAWMDYLGRELLILSKYPSNIVNNETLIEIRKTDLNATWNNIKTIIVSKQNGDALIKKVDSVISQLTGEEKTEKLITLSTKELALVDDIEKYFHVKQ